MERLSLTDFKAKSNESNELEKLSGGILGACHCTWKSAHSNGFAGLAASISDYVHYATCSEHELF